MKTLTKILIIFSIFINFNLNFSYAQLAVGEVFSVQGLISMIKNIVQYIQTNATQVATLGKTAISATQNYDIKVKEYFLDKIALRIASGFIKETQNGMIGWINSGYKGKPLFVQNPEVFYQNIYKAEVSRVTNDLIGTVGDLRDLNSAVARALLSDVTNGAKNFQVAITPNYGGGICNKLRSDVLSIEGRLSSTGASVGVLTDEGKQAQVDDLKSALAEAKSNYNTNCVGTTKSRDQAQRECLKDFMCSGFRGILAIAMNPAQNTEQGRLEAAKAELERRAAEKKDGTKNELLQGNGFLSQRTCEKYKEPTSEEINAGVTPKCEKEKVTTPGQAAVSSLDQIIKDPVQRNQLADELDEAIANVAIAFANQIIKKGLATISDGVEDFSNSLDSELANLDRSLAGQSTTAYRPPTIPTGTSPGFSSRVDGQGTSTQIIEDEPVIRDPSSFTDPNYNIIKKSDKDDIIRPTLDSIETALLTNSKQITFIDKEITNYKNTLNAYNMVADCYLGKYNAQQELIRSGRHSRDSLGTYFIAYPQVIPQNLKDRASELDNLIKGLESRKAANKNAIKKINELVLNLNTTMNYQGIQYYTENINRYIDKNLFTTEWEVRDANNSASVKSFENMGESGASITSDIGLYDKLAKEIKMLTEPNFDTTRNNRGTDDSSGDSAAADNSALGICKALLIEPPVPGSGAGGNRGGPSGDGGGA